MYHMNLLMEGRKLIQIALNYFMCKKKKIMIDNDYAIFIFYCASSFLLEPPLFEFANFIVDYFGNLSFTHFHSTINILML